MEDQDIIALYFAREDAAIEASAAKYGRYCRAIAGNILHSAEDVEECVNDTWWKAWQTIPPHRPHLLSAFLGQLTRRLALDRYRRASAAKRGATEVPLALDELQECVPAHRTVEQAVDDHALTAALDVFLLTLEPGRRRMFLQRYWYLCPIADIAHSCKASESRVKMTLLRTRRQLKDYLQKEGIEL